MPRRILQNDPVRSAISHLLTLEGQAFIQPATVLLRKSALERIGGFQYVPGICPPDVPTFMEQGVSNFTAYTWLCLIAPAGTSKEIVQRLYDALRNAKSNPAIKQRFRESATDDLDMTPEQFREFLAREVVASQTIVRDLGLAKPQAPAL